jgi:hypothetical protein
MTKTKRKKAALDGNRETAKEEKTLAAASPQHDSEAVNRAAALLCKLEQSEPQLFDSWQLSKNPTDASVWLECVHQLRQVARDLKYSDARIKQREEGAK